MAKILLATPIFPPRIGGPSQYCKKLSEKLQEKGVETEVISYNGLMRVPQPFRMLLFFFSVLSKSSGKDVLFSFNLVSCGLPVCLAGKILRKKTAMRLGGDFLWERAFEKGKTEIPLREYYSRPRSFKEKICMSLMSKVLRGTGKIIFTGELLRGIYLEHFKVPKEKTVLVENPFPETEDVPSPSFEDSGIQIIYAGRFLKLKNLDLLLDAFSDLLKESGKDVVLKLIGSGPQERFLKEKAKALGIGENVIFQSPSFHREVLQEIKKSRFGVLVSLTDLTPNFALECLKLAKPCVLTKETEYFRTYGDHFVFADPRDRSDIKRIMLSLLEDDSYRKTVEKIKSLPPGPSWDQVAEKCISSILS